jgi:predicted TIM-barrel fold metal-dependent hydrolase
MTPDTVRSGGIAGAAAAQAKTTMGDIVAIDTHAHIFSKDLVLAGKRRYSPDCDALLGDYLSMLDGNGMSHGVLIQPSFLGTDNTFLISGLQSAPNRLRGIAVVAPETELDELRQLDEAGIVGIRLNLIGQPEPAFGSALWDRHLANVQSLGWQVEVQAEMHRLQAVIPRLLAAGVPLVVDHFGRPDPRLGGDDPGFPALLETADTGGVWVKLSGAYRNGSGEAGARTASAMASRLRAAFGPERLLWGSDWPHTQFETVVNSAAIRQTLDAWLPESSQRNVALVKTPARLFRFAE